MERRNLTAHNDGACDACREPAEGGGFVDPVSGIFLCVGCKLGGNAYASHSEWATGTRATRIGES